MKTENQNQPTDEFAELIPLFMKLFEIVHAKCPLSNRYAQLTIDASGYEHRNFCLTAYYGDQLGLIKGHSVTELLDEISRLDPEAAKKERIAKLKAELQRLEQPDSEGRHE